MKKSIPILIFIAVQIASIATLTLWILWYVSARSQILELARKYEISPSYHTSVLWLLQGIFLMVPVIAGATVIFIYWTKLKVLDNMRINFISSVSHELLTPLASLKLYTETLKLRDVPPDKRQEFLDLMLQDADRLSNLISRILTASKIERKKNIYHFEPTDLARFITEFVAANPHLLKNADLSMELAQDCYARIDRHSLAIVLKNLLENAVRHSHETRASIYLNLTKSPKNLLITLRDHGEGIARKELKKIFRMFYRISKKKGGTGLGLYIVKVLITAHHGKVWAESAGKGEGTTFKITLPEGQCACRKY